MMTSILSTLAVALHRLILIRLSPFSCKRIVTALRCIAVSVTIWLVVFSVFLTNNLFNDEFTFFFSFIQPILNFSAITVSAICYIFVYATLLRSARQVRLSSDAHLRRIAQNKRVLCTFALIVGSNMACWSVYCVYLLLTYTSPNRLYKANEEGNYEPADWAELLINIGWLLVNINAIINPIIYWTRLTDFRRVLLNCCGCRRSSSTPSTAETQLDGMSGGNEHLALSELPTDDKTGHKNEGYKIEV